MKYITGLTNLIISLVVSTIIIYAINFVAENHSLESLTKTELSDYDKLLDLKI